MNKVHDWTMDEFPDVQRSVHYGCRSKCHAQIVGRPGVRRWMKPRANRVQRHAIKEYLSTGREPRGLNITFTCWDIA